MLISIFSSGIKSSVLTLVLLTGVALCTSFVLFTDEETQSSGGVLPAEQAAYDVTFYELSIEVDPVEQRIDGRLALNARVLVDLDVLLLDLDRRLAVDSVVVDGTGRTFHREENRLRVDLPERIGAGGTLAATVYYGGQPRPAPDAPWSGGFTWAETPSGEPWIATSCQTEGADLWWPVKDHPSDEPDSMALHVTVPEPLVVAANGRSRGVTRHADSTRTYHWFASTPVNTYAVALNIAPYDTVASSFPSLGGTTVPVTFWVLPEQLDQARTHLPEFVDHVRFLDSLLGPYPFRADKYGIAHTPFLGMEHQTIIAYGNRFGNHGVFGYDVGFDALHFHELAHEWWGNLVTVSDWKDFWIHEGFATYMEALYAEQLRGREAYHDVVDHQYQRITNDAPTARRAPATSKEVYTIDVYMKGSNVLHTLRYLLGDEAFFTFLRRMAYPTEQHLTATDGSQTRHVDTDEVVQLAEAASGRELDWFFDTYLYHAALPVLATERRGDSMHLRWETSADVPFELPVPVRLNGETMRVEMSGGRGQVEVGAREVAVDPQRWVLRAR